MSGNLEAEEILHGIGTSVSVKKWIGRLSTPESLGNDPACSSLSGRDDSQTARQIGRPRPAEGGLRLLARFVSEDNVRSTL